MKKIEFQLLFNTRRNSYVSICPHCGNFVSVKKYIKGDFLYLKRRCKIDFFSKKELVGRVDEITDHFFWNSPASKLIEKEKYLASIKTFDIFITKKCNSNCKVCFVKWCNEFYQEMSITTLNRLLKTIKAARIVLNGGEPTVRKDLVKIIRLVLESGNCPILYTNGLKISNLAYLQKLKRAGLKEVILSFDGFDERIYELIRGGKHQYPLILKALKNLEVEKMKVSLYSTLVRDINENQVKAILDYAMSHEFVWTISFKPLYLPGTNPSANFNKHHVLSYREIIKLINEVVEEIDLEYFKLTQKIFYSLQKMLAHKNKPLYLSWVDLPCIFLKRNEGKLSPLFSYNFLEKMQTILETNSIEQVIRHLSYMLPFDLDLAENFLWKKKILRLLLGGIMPQFSPYIPPVVPVRQLNGKLQICSYLAW